MYIIIKYIMKHNYSYYYVQDIKCMCDGDQNDYKELVPIVTYSTIHMSRYLYVLYVTTYFICSTTPIGIRK